MKNKQAVLQDVVKIGQRGQITIPIEIREAAKLGKNDVLVAQYIDEKIIFKPIQLKKTKLTKSNIIPPKQTFREFLKKTKKSKFEFSVDPDDYWSKMDKPLTLKERKELQKKHDW